MAAKELLAFPASCDQFLPLQLDDLTRFDDSAFSLPNSPIQLGARHLSVCKLLAASLQLCPQLCNIPLRIANLGLERVDSQLKVEHFGLDHRLQLTTTNE